MHLDVPFSSPAVDAVAELKWHPLPFRQIRDMLGLDDRNGRPVRDLPHLDPTAERGALRRARCPLAVFRHGCVLVESAGVSVLTDPLMAYAHEGAVERFTFHDLPETIDCLLVSHAHQDHTMLETLLQLRHRTQLIAVPRGGGGGLQDPRQARTGTGGVPEGDRGAGARRDGPRPLVVRAHAIHGRARRPRHPSQDDLCGRGRRTPLFFGADTCNVEPLVYQHVYDAVGRIDTVFLSMECDGAPLSWLYGPLVMAPKTADSRRMEESRRLSGSNAQRAIDVVRTLGGERAFVYSMGQEPWPKYLLSLEYEPDSVPIVESDKLIA